jgi:hypothetical protein
VLNAVPALDLGRGQFPYGTRPLSGCNRLEGDLQSSRPGLSGLQPHNEIRRTLTQVSTFGVDDGPAFEVFATVDQLDCLAADSAEDGALLDQLLVLDLEEVGKIGVEGHRQLDVDLLAAGVEHG